MPKALRPGVRYPIVLDEDREIEPTPTFYARSLTLEAFQETTQALRALKDADAENKTEAMFVAFDAIKKSIVGWDNMTDPETGQLIPFNRETLPKLIDINEAMELLGKVITAGRLTADDRKKSESPRSSDAVSFAGVAELVAPE